jgi:hypothetical protein
MKDKNRFPFIHVVRNQRTDGCEAVAAFELASILHARLCITDSDNGSGPEGMHKAAVAGERQERREGLLHALSAWLSSVCMELRIAAYPNIACTPNGRLTIHILIRATGRDEARMREEVACRCLSLQPILGAHVLEAEFVPVRDKDDLKRVFQPFPIERGLSIGRLRQRFTLATPLRRLSIGFGDIEELTKQGKNDSVVDHLFPWVSSRDDWGTLLQTMMGQMEPTLFLVRVSPHLPDPKTLERLRTTIETCERFVTGPSGHDGILNQQARMIRDTSVRRLAELNASCFRVGVFLLGKHPPDAAFAHVVGRGISRYASDEESNLFQGGFCVQEVDPAAAVFPIFIKESGDYSLAEAACAFRLPDPPQMEISGLPVRRSRTGSAAFPRTSRSEGAHLHLFTNRHRGVDQPVTATEADRFRHLFVLGQTGTGKSKLMEHMILQDIHAGRGVAVIDPHGDLVEPLLGKIPAQREQDVIYLDVMDRQRPIGFNVIEWTTPEELDWLVDELFLTLDRTYDMRQVGGPVFENNVRNVCRVICGAKQEGCYVPTLLEFPLFYRNHRFRRWLKKRVSDPQVLDFIKELENTGGELSLDNLSSYITSKFSRFLDDSTLRLIFGQEKTSFDFDEVMNREKILLVNLSKGRFGPTVSAILANQLVTRFKHAAMKRAKIRPEERTPFYLYVDECHNLPPENFSELLSESRKYRLSLTLATQYAGQIKNDFQQSDLLSAVAGNVGTIIIFRLGYEDAQKMAQVLYPNFDPYSIIGLPNHEGYARMQFNGESVPAFSFQTELDSTPYLKKTADRVRKMSQRRYGRDAGAVELAIARRRTIWNDGEESQESLFDADDDDDPSFCECINLEDFSKGE